MVLFTNYGDYCFGTCDNDEATTEIPQFDNKVKHNDLRYYDNITFSDGSVIPDDPKSPAAAAPTPTHAEADVLNIFSDNYSGGLDWSENELRAGWSNGSSEIYDLSGDKMVKIKPILLVTTEYKWIKCIWCCRSLWPYKHQLRCLGS